MFTDTCGIPVATRRANAIVIRMNCLSAINAFAILHHMFTDTCGIPIATIRANAMVIIVLPNFYVRGIPITFGAWGRRINRVATKNRMFIDPYLLAPNMLRLSILQLVCHFAILKRDSQFRACGFSERQGVTIIDFRILSNRADTIYFTSRTYLINAKAVDDRTSVTQGTDSAHFFSPAIERTDIVTVADHRRSPGMTANTATPSLRGCQIGILEAQVPHLRSDHVHNETSLISASHV